MAKQYKLKPKADQDLEKIYRYSVKEWGQNRAEEYIKNMEQSFHQLAGTPNHGSDASYVKPRLKRLLVVSHIIFYKETHYGIEVIRVLHQSMDFKRHL